MNPHLLQATPLSAPQPSPGSSVVARVDGAPDFGALLAELRGRRGLVALDSAGGEPGRWSWIAFEPSLAAGPPPTDPAQLGEYVARGARAVDAQVPGPFAGGFLGALSYDLGVHGEAQNLPGDAWGSPRLVGGLYSDFFVFDHGREEVHLVCDATSSPERREGLLGAARRADRRGPESRGAEGQGATRRAFRVEGALARRVPGALHRARIEAAREAIAAGEIYQANLAHAFEAETLGDPLDLYLELRRVNPAPYMVYLGFERPGGESGALLSASPELLLEVEGEHARTRPIKGTAARASQPELDRELARRLLESAKDRAELAMIVDLSRNDLGRVALAGSVRAEGFPTLRSYPGVHHLMADVVCRLAPGRTALDALLAMFPGGSVSGAPKLRAMEVIGELEGEGRGFFTGSAGFLDVRGNAAFNILIRTLEWRAEGARASGAGRVRFHVGGGITWGSDPAEEERETLVKGAKLAQSLGLAWEVGP